MDMYNIHKSTKLEQYLILTDIEPRNSHAGTQETGQWLRAAR